LKQVFQQCHNFLQTYNLMQYEVNVLLGLV
jgi:hypothetical protein